jgi:hypothetical protein
VEALYWRRPAAAEVAELGFRPEDYPEPEVEVWHENWAALQLFSRFSTQWRVGAGGPVGLDYTVFQHELDRSGIPPSAQPDLMDRLRVIERAALEHIHKD